MAGFVAFVATSSRQNRDFKKAVQFAPIYPNTLIKSKGSHSWSKTTTHDHLKLNCIQESYKTEKQ
jgi:hypothetical protein